jgi:hypothetical protein
MDEHGVFRVGEKCIDTKKRDRTWLCRAGRRDHDHNTRVL